MVLPVKTVTEVRQVAGGTRVIPVFLAGNAKKVPEVLPVLKVLLALKVLKVCKGDKVNQVILVFLVGQALMEISVQWVDPVTEVKAVFVAVEDLRVDLKL